MRRLMMLFSFLFFFDAAHAQPTGYQIQYKDNIAQFAPSTWLPFWKRKLSKGYFNGRYYLIFQFFELPDENHKEILDNNGIRILYFMHNKTYIVSVPEKSLKRNLKTLKFRTIRAIHPDLKISPVLKAEKMPEWIISKDNMIDVNVEFFPDLDAQLLRNELRYNGIRNIFLLKSYNKFRVRIPTQYLYELAKLPWVMWIEPIEQPIIKK